MKITVVGVLILIGGIVLFAIVLDRVGGNLDNGKRVQQKKSEQERVEGNDQLNNTNN